MNISDWNISPLGSPDYCIEIHQYVGVEFLLLSAILILGAIVVHNLYEKENKNKLLNALLIGSLISFIGFLYINLSQI